jgi:hypothetical protein
MTTGAAQRTRHWFGIRPTYYGFSSSFTPIWDWTDGTMGDDASVVSSDVEIDFATEQGMVPRVTLKLSDIAANQHWEFLGEYTLVMAWTISGTDPSVAFRVDGDGIQGEKNYKEASGLGEVGTIRIPAQTAREFGDQTGLGAIEIVFSAELISGTATLTIDKVYAVPRRHFVYTEGVMDSAIATSEIELFMLSENEPLQINWGASSVASLGSPHVINWEMPQDGGVFVYVGGNADDTIGGGVDVIIILRDRWATYRNA